MSNAIARTDSSEIMEQVIIKGDLSKLTPQERTQYYMKVCESIGLNPLTKPFEYIALNGKLQLYALKACTEQLRGIHDVSVIDLTETLVNEVFIVTAKVKNGAGRTDAAKGAVPIKGLAGEALANAMMKAETKAKRRATLSLCGLGWLDESEVESIPGAKVSPQADNMTTVSPPAAPPAAPHPEPAAAPAQTTAQQEAPPSPPPAPQKAIQNTPSDMEWARTVFGQVKGLVATAKDNAEIDGIMKANHKGLKDLERISAPNYETLKGIVTAKRESLKAVPAAFEETGEIPA